MIGQNVLLFIQVKMHVEGILEDTIIVVSRVRTFVKVLVGGEMFVNMHMVCSNAGYTQHNIELAYAKTG